MKGKLTGAFADLISVDKKPAPGEFTIVFAVISDDENADVYLPFFSRVNLNNTAKILTGYGYEVELLKIDVDSSFSKTVKPLPPRKHKAKGKSMKGLPAAATAPVGHTPVP